MHEKLVSVLVVIFLLFNPIELKGQRPIKGDANGDGEINFLDVTPFIIGLTSESLYSKKFPNLKHPQLDMNKDEEVNFLDIAGFVSAIKKEEYSMICGSRRLKLCVVEAGTVEIEWFEGSESGFIIDWGDGSPKESAVGGATHTYDNATGQICIFYPSDTAEIESLRLIGPFKFNTSKLTESVDTFSMLSDTELSGDVADLTETTWLQITGDNTLSGDICDGTQIIYWGITGQNTLGGDISCLNPDTIHVDFKGQNTITGTVPLLSQSVDFVLTGQSTATVPLENLPAAKTFWTGTGTTTNGDLSGMSQITNLFWSTSSSGLITGDIANLNDANSIQIWTPNTITGSISGLTANIVDVRANETIDISTGPVANLNTCDYWRFGGTHSSADIDQFLINLSATTAQNGTVIINGTRTTNSDSAVATLIAAGWSVTI